VRRRGVRGGRPQAQAHPQITLTRCRNRKKTEFKFQVRCARRACLK